MKTSLKYLTLGTILSLLSVSALAQHQLKPRSKPGLFWEISGKGLKSPSYLFGTYHLVGKSFLDTLPVVIDQLNKVNTVVGELIMEDEMTMAQKLSPLMILKEGSLDSILSAKEYAETDSFLKLKTGMNLNALNGLKPSAVQITLIAFLVPKDISPQNPALDMYFQTEARKLNIQVLGLETLEEQGAILFDDSIRRQKEVLLKTVRESDRMMEESSALFESYKQQDLKAIEAAFLKNDDYTPEEMNTLLAKRNKRWITKMPGLMTKGPVFFAVGAGHLVGNDGLITLLRNLGFTLTPMALKY